MNWESTWLMVAAFAYALFGAVVIARKAYLIHKRRQR